MHLAGQILRYLEEMLPVVQYSVRQMGYPHLYNSQEAHGLLRVYCLDKLRSSSFHDLIWKLLLQTSLHKAVLPYLPDWKFQAAMHIFVLRLSFVSSYILIN